jgi:hypothetical protein
VQEQLAGKQGECCTDGDTHAEEFQDIDRRSLATLGDQEQPEIPTREHLREKCDRVERTLSNLQSKNLQKAPQSQDSEGADSYRPNPAHHARIVGGPRRAALPVTDCPNSPGVGYFFSMNLKTMTK